MWGNRENLPRVVCPPLYPILGHFDASAALPPLFTATHRYLRLFPPLPFADCPKTTDGSPEIAHFISPLGDGLICMSRHEEKPYSMNFPSGRFPSPPPMVANLFRPPARGSGRCFISISPPLAWRLAEFRHAPRARSPLCKELTRRSFLRGVRCSLPPPADSYFARVDFGFAQIASTSFFDLR